MSRLQKLRSVTTLWRLLMVLAPVVMGLPSASLAQEDDPSQGPSLRVTMQFVTEKLTGQGPVNVAGYLHDNANGHNWILRQSFMLSNVKFTRRGCQLSYHKKVMTNGSVASDGDRYMLLGAVDDIEVVPKEEAWKRADAKAGNTTWRYKADPPVTVVRLNISDGKSYELEFYEEDLAKRVAKALEHAVYLCGGGREPF